MKPVSSWFRSFWALALLSGAALFLHSHSHAETVPPREDLASFPVRVGSWQGTNVTIPGDILAVLGPGEFFERDYYDAPNDPSIDLFIAYFPSQRTGDTIHSPKHCLPGAGWTPIQSTRISIPWGNGKSIRANFYVLAHEQDRQVAIYWYQSHGRVVASEYWAKFYLVADALRFHRTDCALVRVITPLRLQEPISSGEHRAMAFSAEILPLLDAYIPR